MSRRSAKISIDRGQFLFGVGALAACALAPAAFSQVAPLRVGFIVGIESVPMYVMQARRAEVEAKLGFPIKWMPYLNTNDQLTAFRTGEMDIVEGGTSAFAQLHGAGTSLRVVRGYHNLAFKILVHKDTPFSGVKDLKGKKIGVASLSGTSYVGTAVVLRANGIDPKADAQVVTAAPTNLIASLETKRVDAVTLWDPYVTQALRSGNLKVVLDVRDVYRKNFKQEFLQTAFAVSAASLDANRERIKKFLAAMSEAIEFTIKEPAEANRLALAAGRETMKLTPEELQEARKSFEDVWVREELNLAMIAEIQGSFDRMQELGMFKQRVDVASFWGAP